jgi:DNA-binding IscR family transcriptional regulator
VRLAKSASDIRIGHVVRAMESMAIEIEGDGAAKPSESKERAAGINQILDNALEAFISVLDQHTLQEMALGKKPGALGTGGGKPKAVKATSSRKAAAVNVPRKRQSLTASRLS